MNDTKGLHEELLKADGISAGGVSLHGRDVLQRLRFTKDMSYQGIAAVFGCSVCAVRLRIHCAKRALRSITVQ